MIMPIQLSTISAAPSQAVWQNAAPQRAEGPQSFEAAHGT